jgi:hypothetical protein
MHLLVDTNVFIYREDDRVISQNVSDLFSLLHEIPVELFIHPASVLLCGLFKQLNELPNNKYRRT